MVTTLSPRTSYRYVIEAERSYTSDSEWTPVEGHSVFLLRDLTPAEEASIRDQSGSFDTETNVFRPAINTARHRALVLALVGWENVNDENGNPVEFPTQGTQQEREGAIAFLPYDVCVELGREAYQSVTVLTSEKS